MYELLTRRSFGRRGVLFKTFCRATLDTVRHVDTWTKRPIFIKIVIKILDTYILKMLVTVGPHLTLYVCGDSFFFMNEERNLI